MLILNDISLDPLLKAQSFLTAAIRDAKSELEKAGAVQAFEFCYELAWKTMKRILNYRGLEGTSPREVFRLAAVEKLIDNPETWFEFIRQRNLTVHVYNRKVADEIFDFLPQFAHELEAFIQKIKILKK